MLRKFAVSTEPQSHFRLLFVLAAVSPTPVAHHLTVKVTTAAAVGSSTQRTASPDQPHSAPTHDGPLTNSPGLLATGAAPGTLCITLRLRSPASVVVATRSGPAALFPAKTLGKRPERSLPHP